MRNRTIKRFAREQAINVAWAAAAGAAMFLFGWVLFALAVTFG